MEMPEYLYIAYVYVDPQMKQAHLKSIYMYLYPFLF